MKILKPLALLLGVMFVFTACTFSSGNTRELTSADSKSDAMFEEILVAIENRDSNAIKKLFSKGALAEADDIDASIEYLFNLFDGEVISWERGALGEDGISRHGRYSNLIFAWYDVTTENGKYEFLILNYDENTIDPDLEGLYTLHAIDDEDENADRGTWQALEVPGVYMPKEQ